MGNLLNGINAIEYGATSIIAVKNPSAIAAHLSEIKETAPKSSGFSSVCLLGSIQKVGK
ncbi:hypothetical protein [Chroococcidiopsis cubana]|uniref:hypothetical protein n=1 Tax=Chroococcidiopsis cubana TaxID=171392 RepID=UPI0013155DEC|nr:hypothetical protein [Chroococcidiopsis cubana]